MIREFLARTTSKRHNTRPLYFYLAILLYNMRVLINIVVWVKIIAENLKVFIASKPIEANPFVTNPVQSKRHWMCFLIRWRWEGTPSRTNTVKLVCSQESISFSGMFSLGRRNICLNHSTEIRLWCVDRKRVKNSLFPLVKECLPANRCVSRGQQQVPEL